MTVEQRKHYAELWSQVVRKAASSEQRHRGFLALVQSIELLKAAGHITRGRGSTTTTTTGEFLVNFSFFTRATWNLYERIQEEGMHMDLAEPMNHAAYWTLAVKRAAMRSNRRKGSGPGCVSWLDETPQPKQFRDELLQKLGDLYPLLTSDERKVMDAILDYPSVLVSRNEETDINASELARLLDTSPDTTPYKARQLYQSIKKKARKC